jgi:type II secretion system protein J
MIKNIQKLLNSESGFSILEVLVATAVSSIALLMIYGAHRTVVFSVKDMAGIAEFYENVNLATRRIDRDLECTFSSRVNKRLFMIGENSITEPYNGTINFVTSVKSDMYTSGKLNEVSHISDVKEVGYFLREDPQFQGLFFLMRREAPMYDDNHSEGGRASILLQNVVDIKFEFGKKGSPNWDNKWDSTQNNLYPNAVKTTLKVKDFRGSTKTFSFVSLVE